VLATRADTVVTLCSPLKTATGFRHRVRPAGEQMLAWNTLRSCTSRQRKGTVATGDTHADTVLKAWRPWRHTSRYYAHAGSQGRPVLEHCARVNCWHRTDSSTRGYKDQHMARCYPRSKREKLTRNVDFTRQKEKLTPAIATRENEMQTPDSGDE
jgi:hypothetical protein